MDLSHATLEKGELEYPGKAEELALREKLQAERQARGEAADSAEEYEGMDDADGGGGGASSTSIIIPTLAGPPAGARPRPAGPPRLPRNSMLAARIQIYP